MIDQEPTATIRATQSHEMGIVRELFIEYQRWLDLDLCFQGFDRELATLPGGYASPSGGLWLARVDSEIAGVVGMRALEGTICELKRLWVKPGFRGHDLGRRLTREAIDGARSAGYRTMVLDTLAQMTAARAIYVSFGFVEAKPYYANPLDDVVYFELQL